MKKCHWGLSVSVEENKVIIVKMTGAINSRNLDLLDEFIAPDYVDHTHHLRVSKRSRNS